MKKAILKYECILCFAIISLIYLFTRWYIFKGFNGTDDLHYAMLAARSLGGKYSPFVASDIFSGRVLLVSWQALIYRLGGINAFTTQAGTLFAATIACYLTVFKLVRVKNITATVIASSLFYFNPVLTEATIGPLPDAYVLLAFILILILWVKSSEIKNVSVAAIMGIAIGAIIIIASFFKENALLFSPFIVILSVIERKQKGLVTGSAALVTLIVGTILCLLWYQHNTGDAFFRLKQIMNSSYENPCSYEMLPVKDLIIRLTYGVWKEFIAAGFYPVVLAAFGIFLKKFFDKNYALKTHPHAAYFIVILVIGLYFPFSLKGYQPLCYIARHFLFLLPLAVSVCTKFITENFSEGKNKVMWVMIAFTILIVCIISTPDKWQWMIYGLMIICFAIPAAIFHRSVLKIKYLFFILVLFLCMPYHLFYGNSNWFADMRQLDKNIQSNFFYFPDHDNMMHWEMLHGFNDSLHCFNLEKYPFKIFNGYYEPIDNNAFHAGWLVVNKAYTTRSPEFLKKIDSLKINQYYSRQLCNGDMCVFFIDTAEKLSFTKKMIQADEKVFE